MKSNRRRFVQTLGTSSAGITLGGHVSGGFEWNAEMTDSTEPRASASGLR